MSESDREVCSSKAPTVATGVRRAPTRPLTLAVLASCAAITFAGAAASGPRPAPQPPSPVPDNSIPQPPADSSSSPPIAQRSAASDGFVSIRVATFNLGDVRASDLADPDHPRLKRLAEVIQRLRPNIILLNEIAYDSPPDAQSTAPAGSNARRFVEAFLAVPQAPGLSPLRFNAFAAEVNTGVSSGFDLDNNGKVVTAFPTPPPVRPDGTHPPASDDARDYGGDCWGFGTFPGQYGMALLVDERFEILTDRVRTFRLMPWDFMPGAAWPVAESGLPWYSPEEKAVVRLSSKSHWDVPVRLPNRAVIHLLCSHPTPPVFDGKEDRNGARNHDEIRFWTDYIAGSPYMVDDRNVQGGLDRRSHFVILGDLNADPDEGDGRREAITALLKSPALHDDSPPTSDIALVDRLDPDDTAFFRLRADYVLPSRTLGVLRSGVWREMPTGGETLAFDPANDKSWNEKSGGDKSPAATDDSKGQPAAPPARRAVPRVRFPSDHFPVWVELVVPAGE